MKKKQVVKKPLSRGFIIGIAIGVAVLSLIVYSAINSTVPVNGKYPVITPPSNNFIKATHSPQSGYFYSSQASGSAKGVRSGGGGFINPTYSFKKSALESIHVINEDFDTHSKHNMNIDQFNFHTRDLGYFESQSLTFIADKTGTFEYYCSIHPEMKGKIVVTER